MRSFVLSTYTLKPYGIHPSNFKSRGFFVFSFFCFFLFPFESYDIALQSSGTQQREREKQKINYLFFTLFCFEEGKHLFDEGNEFFSPLSSFEENAVILSEIRGRKRPREDLLPL